MKALVIETKRAKEALGTISYGVIEAEKKSLVFRRSLYVVKAIKAGEVLTKENVRSIRPGFGLPPKYIDLVLGKRVNRDISYGEALQWNMIG